MVSLLDSYLNQKIKWCKSTGQKDSYGEISRDEPTDIPCRIERTNRLTKDRHGSEVVSQTTVLIKVPKGVSKPEDMMDDTLDGKSIISISDMPDLHGRIEGYEVLL